jgi:hypothetical protein
LLDEIKNLDLSAKTFEQFAEFFFARRVVPDEEQWNYFKTDLDGQHYDEAVASSPVTIINYLLTAWTASARYTLFTQEGWPSGRHSWN